MKKGTALSCLLLLIALLMGACENPTLEEPPQDNKNGEKVGVAFAVTHLEQIPFETSGTVTASPGDISQRCTRINLAVFDGAEKVKTVNQTRDETNFGTLSLELTKGKTYQVVIVAHSGLGNATISSPEEIKFKDNKVTDTFYYCGTLEAKEPKTVAIDMKRAVAMFRLQMEEPVPQAVARLQFKYTGGSSTFNAVTGYGCVNSRQTEVRDVEAGAHEGASTYEVFTFPHAEEGELKMTVEAQNANGEALLERVFQAVPVKRNQITLYTGAFFEQESDYIPMGYQLQTTEEWELVEYAF